MLAECHTISYFPSQYLLYWAIISIISVETTVLEVDSITSLAEPSSFLVGSLYTAVAGFTAIFFCSSFYRFFWSVLTLLLL
jgi:hypothetical protein